MLRWHRDLMRRRQANPEASNVLGQLDHIAFVIILWWRRIFAFVGEDLVRGVA